jgi:hypothetical protein
MVIDNLDIQGIAAIPLETDSPAVIDANAPLAGAVAFQGFQAIAGRGAKKFQRGRGAELRQFALGDAADGDPATRAAAGKEGLGVFVAEGSDHAVYCIPINDMRQACERGVWREMVEDARAACLA